MLGAPLTQHITAWGLNTHATFAAAQSTHHAVGNIL